MNQVEKEKIIRTAKAYSGYAAYCLDVARQYRLEGDTVHAEWYAKECREYQKLVSQLEASL